MIFSFSCGLCVVGWFLSGFRFVLKRNNSNNNVVPFSITIKMLWSMTFEKRWKTCQNSLVFLYLVREWRSWFNSAELWPHHLDSCRAPTDSKPRCGHREASVHRCSTSDKKYWRLGTERWLQKPPALEGKERDPIFGYQNRLNQKWNCKQVVFINSAGLASIQSSFRSEYLTWRQLSSQKRASS